MDFPLPTSSCAYPAKRMAARIPSHRSLLSRSFAGGRGSRRHQNNTKPPEALSPVFPLPFLAWSSGIHPRLAEMGDLGSPGIPVRAVGAALLGGGHGVSVPLPGLLERQELSPAHLQEIKE